jgi:hypothetical protein
MITDNIKIKTPRESFFANTDIDTLFDVDGCEITPAKHAISFVTSPTGIVTWTEATTCTRCGGSGLWRGSWHGIQTTGTCYGCDGSGHGRDARVKGYSKDAYARYAKRKEANLARKNLKIERENKERLDNFREELDAIEELGTALLPVLRRTWIKSYNKCNDSWGFMDKVANTLLVIPNRDFYVPADESELILRSREELSKLWIVKSPKTIDALRNMLARKIEQDKEKESSANWTVEGRQEIEGEILTTKFVESDYGTTEKMLLKLSDGRKCWGTVPSKLDKFDIGDIVSIKATISISRDDKTFAFFKRPALLK